MTKNKLKKIFIPTSWIVLVILIIYGIFFWYPAHEKAKHLAEGWVQPTSWNCPKDHPIKANLKSMIYHYWWDPYYARTNAMSGRCFDTGEHARNQGFRPIYNEN